ncbi:MAG: FtsX-like permease family protein, partial [Pseudohongiellaceae bacterium]
LVMVVADKGADIAILRTMGASRRTVMGIFVVQGFIAGIIGTVLGATLGVLLTLNISRITAAIEQLVNLTLSPDSIYMISYLQSELRWIDVLVVCFAALLISFLATLYPAWRAARVQPAAVLRYE